MTTVACSGRIVLTRLCRVLLAAVGVATCSSPVSAGGGGPAPLFPPPLPRAPVRELRLAAAPNGDLILATLVDSVRAHSRKGVFTAREVFASRWTAGRWVPLGGALNYDRPRPASTLDLALDRRGTPVLAWNENYGDNDIIVFRAYQGGHWTDWRARYIGDDLPYAARTRGVAAWNGEPVIAFGEWLRKPDGSQLTVRTWQTNTWQRGPRFNDVHAFSRSPAIALDAAARPVVTWIQGDVLSSNLLAARWTGQAWAPLGGPLNRRARTYLASPRLVLDAGSRPVVAWMEDQGGQDTLYVSRWTGRQWLLLGGAVSQGFSSAPSLALDPQGHPVLAWVEEHGNLGRIRWARWNGRAWQGSAVQNLDAQHDARSPAVVVTPTGRVLLAWREDVGGRYQVQVRAVRP
ncbi:hypothetical protein E7T09_16460 [Deinococcus sp. KSM4-11]|uniref:hypothetical protein n=1 Tax=Deinococcus sp. KSM4-11 TaxID=2568654 RepID=UPI0010A58821|nr:hypothetical protein [Deinococcus sp. KSM4-11]THF85543.1 hypothetical protein E7T09_16460 [Deinococcus sp. KSM4-11]